MQVDATIKDFIFILGSEAIRTQSLPGMMEIVEKGTSAVAYNFLIGPVLARFTAKFGSQDLMNITEKVLIYPALISLMTKLIYGQPFNYSKHFIDVMIGIGAQEVYDIAVVGKVKKYF